MLLLDRIRMDIKHLYETNPNIHMNVSPTKPKLTLENAAAKITGVYPHIFQIEENSTGSLRRHTLQYSEVMSGQISILELKK